MRVLQAIWSLAPQNGGPTRSTIGLAQALAQNGCEVTVWVGDARCEAKDEPHLHYVMGRGDVYRMAVEDINRVIREFHPDVIHIQGLWRPSHHAAAVAARKSGVPYVISPRGMLAPWALGVKKWKKLLGMFLYQRKDLRLAAAIPCTSEDESRHTHLAGFKNETPVIPNGIVVPDASCFVRDVTAGAKKTALFMSRLTPGKGLLLLVEAWAKLRPVGWRMIVAGPDKGGHRNEVEDRIHAFGLTDDWTFVGEVSDDEKWRYYANADLFIHPSASENFGLSIAEALASGVPVITTKGTPWSEIANDKTGRCGWWIERSVLALEETMRLAMNLTDDERLELGARGRQLISTRYVWPAIALEMKSVYERAIVNNQRKGL